MRLTVVSTTMVLLAAMLMAAVPSQAAYSAFEYEVLITDESGDTHAGGFLDVTELAVAVIGGELIWRITTSSTEATAQDRSHVELKFTTDAPKRFAFKNDGSYSTEPNDKATDKCEQDGSTYYCPILIDGPDLRLTDGMELKDVHVLSKLYVQEAGLGDETEKVTYKIPGGAVETGPEVTKETLDSGAAKIELTGDGSDAIYEYTWNNTFEALSVVYEANVTSGTVDIVAATNGTELVNKSFSESSAHKLDVEEAVVGTYTISINMAAFEGSVLIDLKELVAQTTDDAGNTADETGETASETGDGATDGNVTTDTNATADDNTTLEEKEGLPGFGLVAVLAAFGLLAVAVRRRD